MCFHIFIFSAYFQKGRRREEKGKRKTSYFFSCNFPYALCVRTDLPFVSYLDFDIHQHKDFLEQDGFHCFHGFHGCLPLAVSDGDMVLLRSVVEKKNHFLRPVQLSSRIRIGLSLSMTAR